MTPDQILDAEPAHDTRPLSVVFKPVLDAIAARSAQLADWQENLLDCLRDAQRRLPPRDETWGRLIWISYEHQKDQTSEPPAGNTDRLEALVKKLRGVQTELLQIRRYSPDMANELTQFWCCQNSDFSSVFEEADFEKTVDALNVAAEKIAEKHHKRPGNHTKPHLTRECIYALAALYRDCTGKPRGASDGPFASFVHQFSQAHGIEREFNTIVADLKAARKGNPSAFNV